MPLFDAFNRLTADPCAVKLKDAGNLSIASYTLTNMRPADDGPSRGPTQFAAKYPNLHSWDGYGMDVHAIDQDSMLRVDSEMTHPRSKIQLPKRVFQASPNLSVGALSPDLQSMMKFGINTSPRGEPEPTSSIGGGFVAPRHKLAEHDWNRFVPGVTTVPVQHVVPTWIAGGAPSRSIARTEGFKTALAKAGVRAGAPMHPSALMPI